MPGLSNAQLAQQVSTLVDLWNQREREFRDWVGGTATGGPQGDGRYPLTNGLGVTSLVPCPASLASTVSGPGASASAAKLAAEAARDFALSYRDAADQSRVLAQAAQAAAVAARDLTLQYRDRAAAAEANALVYKQAAEAAATALGTARDTAVQAKTDAVAAKGAAEAARDLAQGYAAQAATFNPANYVATSGFTWGNLGGKPSTFTPSAHTHTIADVASLQAALDGKLTVYSGLTLGYAAFQSNSLGLDSALGDGLLNIVGGANHARMTNATGTGHVYQGTRGASRIGLHDNTINLYVGDKASGAAVAGQAVTWTQVATLATTGFASYVPLTVTGNIVASGSAFVGASGGLFVNGQAHRIYFDAAGGARASLRTDHAAAVGLNLQTSDGTHRGALYYDGSLGLLNQVNGWRLRTTSGSVSVYSDAGVESKLWSHGSIPTSLWQNSDDGKNRFYFAPNSDSVWKSAGNHQFRNASDTTVVTFDPSGAIATSGNVRAVSTGGTGQFTAVSGNTMAGFYNDGTQFYILKSATSNGAFDGHRPLFVNLANGGVYLDNTGAGGVNVGGSLIVGGGLAVNGTGGISINGGELWMGTGHWIRMNGSEGIYWQQWGGGWYMSDASYMRCYGNKTVYTGGFMQADAGMISQGGRVFRHANGGYANSSITYSTAGPSGGGDGDIWFQYS